MYSQQYTDFNYWGLSKLEMDISLAVSHCAQTLTDNYTSANICSDTDNDRFYCDGIEVHYVVRWNCIPSMILSRHIFI